MAIDGIVDNLAIGEDPATGTKGVFHFVSDHANVIANHGTRAKDMPGLGERTKDGTHQYQIAKTACDNEISKIQKFVEDSYEPDVKRRKGKPQFQEQDLRNYSERHKHTQSFLRHHWDQHTGQCLQTEEA